MGEAVPCSSVVELLFFRVKPSPLHRSQGRFFLLEPAGSSGRISLFILMASPRQRASIA
jgi:hypothetical protein